MQTAESGSNSAPMAQCSGREVVGLDPGPLSLLRLWAWSRMERLTSSNSPRTTENAYDAYAYA